MTHIRAEDLAEVEAGGEGSLYERHLSSLEDAVCLVDDETDEVYAIGGVDDRIVWVLCTTRVEDNKVKFLRFTRLVCQELLKTTDYLYNAAWKGNELHLKWLKWLGAEFVNEVDDHVLFILKDKKKEEEKESGD